jgi:hypothetical protein
MAATFKQSLKLIRFLAGFSAGVNQSGWAARQNPGKKDSGQPLFDEKDSGQPLFADRR